MGAMTTEKSYSSDVSRTLPVEDRAWVTVKGLHDHPLSDADVNLIQDVQDWKRSRVLAAQAPSGCLSRKPFVFSGFPNSFTIPAFDFLFRGEVIHVGGNRSTDRSLNVIQVPAPVAGLVHGRVYIVFLEMWYSDLTSSTGSGYYVVDGTNYVYPGGCVDADESSILQLPDDTVDPGFGEVTTDRVQLQWRLRVQAIDPNYDFGAYRLGMDPDPMHNSHLYARGGAASVTSLPYTPLAPVTGETTLWRAGGDPLNAVKALDGYTYATPVAAFFQRTLSIFDPESSPFGCASTTGGGTFASQVSGRFDGRFADVVVEGDVVDTRLTTSLTGYDMDPMLKQGLLDVTSGNLRAKVAPGECPKGSIGSLQTYQTGFAPTPVSSAWSNIHSLGVFDGMRNGFSSDERTYFTSKQFLPPAGTWKMGDVVSASTGGAGLITSVFVQAFNEAKRPVSLMGSQVTVTGLGTASVSVTLASDLTAYTALNPGNRPLLLTLGVTYPAGSDIHLQRVPHQGMVCGSIQDPAAGSAGLILPVFGVSDYETSTDIPLQQRGTVTRIRVYSPNYSVGIFGVRAHLTLDNSKAVLDASANTSTFTIVRTNLDGRFSGLYVTRALDATGQERTILARAISGMTLTVSVKGLVDPASTTELIVFCHSTAQACISPAVMGVIATEEVVLMGCNLTATSPDILAAIDSRLVVFATSVSSGTSTVTGYVRGGAIRGIAGEDEGGTAGYLWVMKGTSSRFVPVECSIVVSGSAFTITVPDANLASASWFLPVSLLPSFQPDVTAIFSSTYVPYQGEAIAGREYQVVATADTALVTSNGTGAAPVPGVHDVFPDRQRPVAVALPALSGWKDSDLDNSGFRSATNNQASKRADNTEVTLDATLRVNDFVPPLHGSIRRKLRLSSPAARGFARVHPHVGFAINPPVPNAGLGLTYSTEFALTLYVDNVNGLDTNDGLTVGAPLKTLKAALGLLPPIICHPVSILLAANEDKPYRLADLLSSNLTKSSVDGGIYCVGEIAFTMQGTGGLVIGRTLSGTGSLPVIFDGTGFDTTLTGGTAPVMFLVSKGRVAFNGLTFTGFEFPAAGKQYGAVRAYDSEVEFVDCHLVSPFMGVTSVRSNITWTRGSMSLGSVEVGINASNSTVVVDGPILTNTVTDPATTPGTFFAVNAGGTITFTAAHTTAQEVGFPIPGSGFKVPTVVRAELASSIVVAAGFQTAGYAYLYGNSVAQFQNGVLPPKNAQFGFVSTDPSSTTVGLFN